MNMIQFLVIVEISPTAMVISLYSYLFILDFLILEKRRKILLPINFDSELIYSLKQISYKLNACK